MLVNMANEFSTGDPVVQPLIELARRRFRQVSVQIVTQAQACGELSTSPSPVALALFMHCAMSGLRTQAKSGIARNELLGVIDMVMMNLR
jgi:hypothetical protein